MIKKYGAKKGKEVFYAKVNKHGWDDTKPMPSSKEHKVFDKYGKIEAKEAKEELYTKGYVATTHVDTVNDKIMPETLYKWAEEINSTSNFDAKPVSLHHERGDPSLIGLGANAKVERLSDGEHGLWVETHHNKSHPDFQDVKYQLDNNFLTHYSIEYDTQNGATTHKEHIDGKWVRVIEPDTPLLGYGLASPRTVVNKEASISETSYKELISMEAEKTNEVKEMKEKKEDTPEEKQEEKTEDKPDEAEAKKEEPKEEPKEDKEEKELDVKGLIAKEVKEQIKQAVTAEVKETTPENAPMLNKGAKMETKERKVEQKELEFKEVVTEYKEAVLDNKSHWSDQYHVAGKLEKEFKERGMMGGADQSWSVPNPFEIKENKFVLNRPELKAAVTTDADYMGAQTTFITALANYEQTPARYNDVYGPVIVNQLNDMTTTWNLLTKENMSGMSAIRVRARTGRNATADTYAYGSTPGFDGSAAIKKFNVNFVTSYVEVAAEFEAIEFGMGAGGIDVWANEIKFATKDLMTYLNGSQLYGTGDGTSESDSLGFDGGLIISSGTLYGKDVASFTTLAAAGVDDMSSAAITLKKLRAMIRACVTNGADPGDLFFTTSYLQYDFIKALIQDMQRIVPTSAKVGFTGVMELDGVPIFADKDLDANSMTDDVFLIDRAHTKIGIKKAPTYVEFGLTSLVRNGIIWMMWNVYSDAPNHNYHIYGLATS